MNLRTSGRGGQRGSLTLSSPRRLRPSNAVIKLWPHYASPRARSYTSSHSVSLSHPFLSASVAERLMMCCQHPFPPPPSPHHLLYSSVVGAGEARCKPVLFNPSEHFLHSKSDFIQSAQNIRVSSRDVIIASSKSRWSIFTIIYIYIRVLDVEDALAAQFMRITSINISL